MSKQVNRQSLYNLSHIPTSSNTTSVYSQREFYPSTGFDTIPGAIYINPAFSPTVFIPQSVLSTMESSFVSSMSRCCQLDGAAVKRGSKPKRLYTGFGGEGLSYRLYGKSRMGCMFNSLQPQSHGRHELSKQDGRRVSSEGNCHNNNSLSGSRINNSNRLNQDNRQNSDSRPTTVPSQQQQHPSAHLFGGARPNRLAAVLAGPKTKQKVRKPKALRKWIRRKKANRDAGDSNSTSTPVPYQKPSAQLFKGVHPDRLARILAESAAEPQNALTSKEALGVRNSNMASGGQSSTSNPVKDEPSLLQLVMESAMSPGLLGEVSKDILRLYCEKLMAAGVEVQPEIAVVLMGDDGKENSTPASTGPCPRPVKMTLATSTFVMQDRTQETASRPVKCSCSKSRERYVPYGATYTGEDVSCVNVTVKNGLTGENGLAGENGSLRKSACDPTSSMFSNEHSATLPQPLSTPPRRQEASSASMTVLATTLGRVGLNMKAAGSPLSCSRDDLLTQHQAAANMILELTEGLSLRTGLKD